MTLSGSSGQKKVNLHRQNKLYTTVPFTIVEAGPGAGSLKHQQ